MLLNKQRLLVISLLATTIIFSGCRSKKYEEQIAQLEKELAESNGLLSKTDSTMDLISIMLDSVEVNQEVFNTDLANVDEQNQDSILLKIEGAKAYITYSRAEIERLEQNLAEEVANSSKAKRRINGLLGTITRLKKDLQTKEDSLIVLNDRIVNLEEDKSNLANTVQKQISELSEQENLIANQEEKLLQKQEMIEEQNEALEQKERAVKMQEAEKFYALGKQDETLGDKTKFAPKKKKSYYQSAELYYQQAYELGKADAKEAMYNVKNKSIKVKFAGKGNN